jgi:hypothetical protein
MAIEMECGCESKKKCYGELYIEKLEDEPFYIVTVVDSAGNDEGSMYLTKKGIQQLIGNLQKLIEKD